jgi:DNA polymerase-3 subunit epsilon
MRLAIEKNKKNLDPVYRFHYLIDGHAVLRKLIKEFNLCPKLCFMQTDNEKCTGIGEAICFGACEKREKPDDYNKRTREAIASLNNQPTFMIVDKGMNEDERSCILVENGKLHGMGYIPSETAIHDIDSLKDHLQQLKENSFISNLLSAYAIKNPSKVVMMEETSQSIH